MENFRTMVDYVISEIRKIIPETIPQAYTTFMEVKSLFWQCRILFLALVMLSQRLLI